MKWLNDKDSVSQKELEANWGATDEAVYSESWIAAYKAASGAACGALNLTAYLVDEYFEITDEDRNEYERELNK
jgi:hypothetical protein